MLTGQNGILSQTTKAKQESEKAEIIEQIFEKDGSIYNTVLEVYSNEKGYGPLATNKVITKVKFGDNVTVRINVGYALFFQCTNLKKVYNYPKGLTSLQQAFANTSVTKIPDIPEGVTDMYGFLYDNTSITSFPKISSTVERIEEAFHGCTSISGDLYIYSNNISNAKNAFYGINNYYTIYVDENTTSYETLSNALTDYGAINKKPYEIKITKIVSWGDSLTAGAGGGGTFYWKVLDSLIKEKHFIAHGGVGGESVQSIAARQGGNPVYVNEFTIPATTALTEITIHNKDNNSVTLARQGTSLLNPVYINGISGNITYDSATSKYYFKRLTQGQEVKIDNNTQIITSGMKNNRDDLMIIWAGTNNLPNKSTVQTVIKHIDSMLEYSNNEDYIIIGLTSKSYMPEIEEVNQILSDHFNSYGYTIVGTQVYNKLISLGYIEE